MNDAPKVPLCRLFEKTSANGNRYFVGRLGSARVLMFRDTKAEGTDPQWNLLVQEADNHRINKSVGTPSTKAKQAAYDMQAPVDRSPPAHDDMDTGLPKGF
jgi:hypothetical protein